MNHLLSKSEYKILSLIEYLYKEKNSLSIEEISKKFDISKYTILTLLDQLELFLQDINHQAGTELHLNRTQNQRLIQLTTNDSFPIELVKEQIFQQSIGYQLAWTIFIDRFDSINHFCQKHLISRARFQDAYKHLEIVLSDFDLTIRLGRKEIIQGEEKTIRCFYYSLFFVSGTQSKDFLQINHQQSLDRFIETLTGEYSYYTETDLTKINLVVAISLHRIKHGNSIPTRRIYETVNLPISFKDFSSLLQASFSSGYHDSIFTKEERLFCYHWYSSLLLYSIQQITEFDFSEIMALPLNEKERQWLDILFDALDLELDPIEMAFLSINFSNIFECFHHFKIIEELSAEVTNLDHYTEQYPMVTNLVFNFLTKLPNFQAYLGDALFMESTFLILRTVLLNKTREVTIFLYSSINHIQEDWLKWEIKNYADVPIKIAHSLSVQPDLIITDKFFKSYEQYPVFFWNSIPSHTELFKLRSRLRSIYYSKNNLY